MGRPKVKEIPEYVQEILDYVNGKGVTLEDGSFHMPKEQALKSAIEFLVQMVWIARQPIHERDGAVLIWNRISFNDDGRIELKPLPSEHPIISKALSLREEEFKRILLCPGCSEFVWRKKIDSQTCSRKCADKYNNQKRKERRGVEIEVYQGEEDNVYL